MGQFEKAIGKNWSKGSLTHNKLNNPKDGGSSNRPDLPKDRPYQGIQFSTNINMEM